jgi:hypothetical protein
MNLNTKQKSLKTGLSEENFTTTRFRSTLLSDIWDRDVLLFKPKKFETSSASLMLPRVQLVRTTYKKEHSFEMYNTSSDLYYIMEDWKVYFAYKHDLQVLSDSLCFTFKHSEVEKTRRKKCNTEDEILRKENRLETLYESLNRLKKRNVINLKQVKNEYNQEFINAFERQ